MITLIQDMDVLGLMTPRVAYIAASKTVFEALIQMSREEVPELLIGTPDQLQGIITLHDFSSARKLNLPDDLHKPLSGDFVHPVHTIDDTASAETARNRMREFGIGCLPVIRSGVVIGIIRTIDIMNKFYAQIESAKETYARSFNQMSDGVCVVNAEGAVLALSKSAEEDYELPASDVAEDQAFFPIALLNKALRTKEPIEDVIHCPRQGKVLEVSAIPLYSDGRLIGALSTNRDVTNQMELAHDLEDAKKRLNLLQNELNHFSAEVYQFSSIIGTSQLIRETISLAQRAAESDDAIIIYGPSGAGKEFFARSIHHASKRDGVFVPINCGVLSKSVLEGELLGYSSRAFDRFLCRCQDESFELAHGGTVFLDDLGSLSPEHQQKLLHILEHHPEEIHWRFVSASTEDEAQLKKKLLPKLVQHLLEQTIIIAPLHERPEDVRLYLKHFFKEHCRSYNKPVFPIDPEVIEQLVAYHWPGNVREINTVVEQMVLFAKNRFTMDLLPGQIAQNEIRLGPQTEGLYRTAEQVEAGLIEQALAKVKGNKSDCAKLLGISRPTLYYKLEKYNISYPMDASRVAKE